MTERTLFQQLVTDNAVSEMIKDLNNLEALIPDDQNLEDHDGWELALTMHTEDVPRIIEELQEIEELNNEQK